MTPFYVAAGVILGVVIGAIAVMAYLIVQLAKPDDWEHV
jgi:hypothetical protein